MVPRWHSLTNIHILLLIKIIFSHLIYGNYYTNMYGMYTDINNVLPVLGNFFTDMLIFWKVWKLRKSLYYFSNCFLFFFQSNTSSPNNNKMPSMWKRASMAFIGFVLVSWLVNDVKLPRVKKSSVCGSRAAR